MPIVPSPQVVTIKMVPVIIKSPWEARSSQLRTAGLKIPPASFIRDPIFDWLTPLPILLPGFLTGLSWERVLVLTKSCAGKSPSQDLLPGMQPKMYVCCKQKESQERMSGSRQATQSLGIGSTICKQQAPFGSNTL